MDSTINLIISDLRKHDIKEGLKEGRIVYLSVFLILEPLYDSLKESKKEG